MSFTQYHIPTYAVRLSFAQRLITVSHHLCP